MDDNKKERLSALLLRVAPYIARIEELEAVMAALDASWCALQDDQRRLVASSVRRGLVDLACSLEADPSNDA